MTERPLYAGETAAVGTPLLVVMDTSSVIAKAHLPQSVAAVLQAGDAASLVAPGNVKVAGKVSLVSPALDPNSTTVEVWVVAPNPDGALRPGTSVSVQMIARTVKDALVVPTPALLKTTDGEAVMIVGSDGAAHQVAVETGIRQGARVQITKGLAGGERVITSGGYGIPDGTKVVVANAASPDAKGGNTTGAGDKNESGKD